MAACELPAGAAWLDQGKEPGVLAAPYEIAAMSRSYA